MSAEGELGGSEDARALVLGDPDALHATVAHLRSLSDAFGRTAAGLARTDVGSWSGTAGDAFRARFGAAPRPSVAAADAFEHAATAWEAFVRVVEWAQGRAAEAVSLYRSGVAESGQAVADRNRLQATAPVGTTLPPFVDPGVAAVRRAQEILADARRQRDALGTEAARVLAEAAARAPDPPSGRDMIGAEAADTLDALGTEGVHFMDGLATGTAALVGAAAAIDPFNPQNTLRPARYLDAVSTGAAGLVTSALHPAGMLTGLVGTGWGSDPARAGGTFVPNLAAAVVGGGVGRSALGRAERAVAGRPAEPPATTPTLPTSPRAGAAPVPQGFAGAEDFGRFGARLHNGLAGAGFPDARAALQGSAVTGQSFRTGSAFDAGRMSDYDVALAGPGIFDAAAAEGIGLRSAGSRTGPLTEAQLGRLGLAALRHDLSAMAGREVNLMIYRDMDDVLSRSPSIGVPGS